MRYVGNGLITHRWIAIRRYHRFRFAPRIKFLMALCAC